MALDHPGTQLLGRLLEERTCPAVLSPLDDLPIHQVTQPVRQVGTSDRNFYDRYYFNCHPCGPEAFLIMGMGQYPNLGVTDAFALLRTGDEHRVEIGRASGREGVCQYV